MPKPAGGVRLIQALGRRGAGHSAPGAACLHDAVLALRVEGLCGNQMSRRFSAYG